MARGKAHSNEVKAQVMAALLAGQSINEVAETYQLPSGTVKFWASQSPEFVGVKHQKRQELDDLISEYVREAFVTLSVQVKHFRQAEWLNKQHASEVAVLHGVITDKAIRILEAGERANAAERDSDQYNASFVERKAGGDAPGSDEVPSE